MEVKHCNHCQIDKNINEFDVSRNVCKQCRNISAKMQRNEKKITNIVVDSNATRTCDECHIDKHIGLFEGNRKTCKECRKQRRNTSAKDETKKKSAHEIPMPEKCIHCCKGPNEVTFKWRTDLVAGGWSNICNECYNSKKYYEKYREHKREEDSEGFKAHNTATHRAWCQNNPDKVNIKKEKIQKD